ncbi:DUF5681 domain-containing protein [Nioella aestuarii]|uniref:DUF5681 domain-containing protein n=1 Tax=Nioella aestuarii TaxID=1662864 RepID=UPI003D7F5B66
MGTQETPGDDYEVGYGKPPKHTQFKKGQSGNPSGKAKKEASLQATLEKILNTKLSVTKNGQQVQMTKLEAALEMLVQKATKGSHQHLKLLIQLADEGEAPLGPEADLVLADADLAVLKTHADWVGLVEAVEEELNAQKEDGQEQGGEHDD